MTDAQELVKELTEMIEFHELHVTDEAAVDLLLRANTALNEWKKENEENAAWFTRMQQDNMHELS